MSTSTEEGKEKVKIRHCAYCLLSLPRESISLCGQCKRRAYCSRECQKADWSPKGKGQGHKVWCSLQCGEEDLDWEVAPIPGKGLGLIAKRALPSKFRIMVDACRAKDHPGIQNLMPHDGNTEEKFALNCLGCNDSDEEEADLAVLCLRLSRANHNCDANAGHVYDKTFKVKIVYAERKIQEGEEICISYLSFNSVSKNYEDNLFRSALATNWGIICSKDCFCRNFKIKKLVKRSQELDSTILHLGSSGNQKAALAYVEQLMRNHESIHSSLLDKTRTLYDGFQIAIMKKETLKLGSKYAKQLYEIESAIFAPGSEKLKVCAEYVNNPQSHINFLNE